jgi:hypothetical protein
VYVGAGERARVASGCAGSAGARWFAAPAERKVWHRVQREFGKPANAIRIVFHGSSPSEDKTLDELGVFGESRACFRNGCVGATCPPGAQVQVWGRLK